MLQLDLICLNKRKKFDEVVSNWWKEFEVDGQNGFPNDPKIELA